MPESSSQQAARDLVGAIAGQALDGFHQGGDFLVVLDYSGMSQAEKRAAHVTVLVGQAQDDPVHKTSDIRADDFGDRQCRCPADVTGNRLFPVTSEPVAAGTVPTAGHDVQGERRALARGPCSFGRLWP